MERKIVIGDIYVHLNNPREKYQVIETGLLDATGYEKTGKVGKIVKY